MICLKLYSHATLTHTPLPWLVQTRYWQKDVSVFTCDYTYTDCVDLAMPDPCEEAYSLSVVVFNETAQYPHPFPLLHYEPWGDTPRTIVELRMCALSATIRDKPQWHEKMKDPAIKQKWREEALEQGSAGLDEKPEWRLTERMVYVQ